MIISTLKNDLSVGWFSEDGFHYDPFVSFIYLKLKATYADGSTREFSFLIKTETLLKISILRIIRVLTLSNAGDCLWKVGTTENAYAPLYTAALR